MRFFVVLISCGMLFSCGENNSSPVKKVLSGKEVYENNCAICHGSDGKLGSGGAKDLSLSILSLEERIAIISNGKNGMTPFKGMISDEEITASAEYIESLRK